MSCKNICSCEVNKLERQFYLVDAQVLPEVFLKVVEAKKLLAGGRARNITEAVRCAGLSRSAFYKYKDCIFDSENGREMATVMATLRDRDRCAAVPAGRHQRGRGQYRYHQPVHPGKRRRSGGGDHPHGYDADVPGGTHRQVVPSAHSGQCALRLSALSGSLHLSWGAAGNAAPAA